MLILIASTRDFKFFFYKILFMISPTNHGVKTIHNTLNYVIQNER